MAATLVLALPARAHESRVAPAVLVEGSLVAWARCSAMAEFGERAGRAACHNTGASTVCDLGAKGSLAVMWDRDQSNLVGDLYHLPRDGRVRLLGDLVSPNSLHAELRTLRGNQQVASQCDVVVRGDVVSVEWTRK